MEKMIGPQPLALHVAMMSMLSTLSTSALDSLKNGSLLWKGHNAPDLINRINAVDGAAFAKAVQEESLRRQREFSGGIKRYTAYERSSKNPANVIKQHGTTRLLDFGIDGVSKNDQPLLIIPSLINRYHVLDLSGHHSFVRSLAQKGFHPYIVDWDIPGSDEMTFGLSDYVGKRLEPFLNIITDRHQSKPSVIGYCMGGLLALGLVTRQAKRCRALALLATPWDFHVGHETMIMTMKAMQPQTNLLIDTLGLIPMDIIQAMFTSLNPWMSIEKFRRFSRRNDTSTPSEQDNLFVELEDWLNNGTPLAGPTAKECINGWYIENTPAMGQWCLDGTPVRPQDVKCPAFVVIPKQDHIVPPQSASAIIDKLPQVETLSLDHGHIGMIAGARAEETLFTPLSGWLSRQI